jgi:alpha-glucosidase
MDFSFKDDNFVELESWGLPNKLVFASNDTFLKLFENIKDIFGTQPVLPEWVYNGLIIGVQGGTDRAIEIMERTQDYGIDVAGLWCQDWQGKKITSFGKRLYWNWQWSEEMYPELDTKIHELKAKKIRFMGYINPYLIQGSKLYEEAFQLGYFALSKDDQEYVVDFGEFYCGVIDFTNPQACRNNA